MEINRDGFATMTNLLAKLNQKGGRRKVTEADVAAIVKDCPKKRFQMQEVDGVLCVRAAQGHTIRHIEDEELLTRIEAPEEVPLAVHGTTMAAWKSIEKTGLNRGSRNHIHLAVDLPGSDKVVSGARSTSKVFIFIDVRKAMEDGIVFFRSTNNVVLTRGVDGVLHPKYFERVTFKS